MQITHLTRRIAFISLWLFVFSIPLAQIAEVPMIGNISRWVGIAAALAGVAAVVARRQIRLLGPLHLAMASFILWSTVTLCWSVAPNLTVQRVGTYLQLFVLVLLLWELCVEEKDILAILSAFVLGAIFPALATLYAFIPGQNALILRASVPGYDPNQLAFLLALSLPAAYFLILREKGAIVSLYRLQMGFAVCAILLTGSVTTLIAMIVGLSLMFWNLHAISFRTRANVFGMFTLLAAALVLLIPSVVLHGIADQSRKGEITFASAADNGVEGLHAAPIGGSGAGTQATHLSGIHPTPLTMFNETGAVGVLCFMAVFGALLLAAERMPGVNKSFWLTSLAVWAAGAFTLNWDCSQPAWLIFGLLAAHSACLSGEPVTELKREKQERMFDERAQVWS